MSTPNTPPPGGAPPSKAAPPRRLRDGGRVRIFADAAHERAADTAAHAALHGASAAPPPLSVPGGGLGDVPSSVRAALREGGVPLPGHLRAPWEAAFQAPLGGVRLHTGPAAVTAAADVHAQAFAVGQDVVLGAGHAALGTHDGQALLAHEVAHTVQQAAHTGAPVLMMLEDDMPPLARMSASLHALVFTPPSDALYGPGETRPQVVRIMLRALVGDEPYTHAHARALDAYVATLEARREATAQSASLQTGTSTPGSTINPTRVDAGVAYRIVLHVRDTLHLPLRLTEAQIELLRLGAQTTGLWRRVQPRLPAWYGYGLFMGEIAREADLLRTYASAAESFADPARLDAIALETAQRLRLVADVVDAIANDATLGTIPAGTGHGEPYARAQEVANTHGVLVGVRGALTGDATWQAALAERNITQPERLLGMLMDYIRTQPPLAEQVRGSDAAVARAARRALLEGYVGWLNRGGARATPTGDTQQLTDSTQGRVATDPPFRSRLEISPAATGTSQRVALETPYTVTMHIHFPDVFDAMGQALGLYSFRWELIPLDSSQTRPEHVRPGQRGAAPSRSAVTGARRTRLLETLNADIQRLQADLGPYATGYGADTVAGSQLLLGGGGGPADGATMVAGAHILLSGLGEGISTVFTDSIDAGRTSTRKLVFPGMGNYAIRCSAVRRGQIPTDASDEVRALYTRPPSVALFVVSAVYQQALAVEHAQASTALAESVEDRIIAIENELDEPQSLTPEQSAALQRERDALVTLLPPDPEAAIAAQRAELRRQMQATIDSYTGLPGLRGDLTGLQAELQRLADDTTLSAAERRRQRSDLEARMAALQARITRLESETAPYIDRLFNRELRSQLNTLDAILALRAARRDADTSRILLPLNATFTSDAGAVLALQLGLHTSTVVAGGRTQHHAYISDTTTPDSGEGEATAATERDAIRLALRALLEGSSNYGRGTVAFRHERATVPQRIEASGGRILMSTVEETANLLSLAAVLAAPFTAGASLTLLVPFGVASGAVAAYRVYERVQSETFRIADARGIDLANITDLVGVVGAFFGLSQVRAVSGAVAASRYTVVRLGGGVAAVIATGANAGGLILLGAGIVEQLMAAQSLPPAERADALVRILGRAFVSLGVAAGGFLTPEMFGGTSRPRPTPPTPDAPTPVAPPVADAAPAPRAAEPPVRVLPPPTVVEGAPTPARPATTPVEVPLPPTGPRVEPVPGPAARDLPPGVTDMTARRRAQIEAEAPRPAAERPPADVVPLDAARRAAEGQRATAPEPPPSSLDAARRAVDGDVLPPVERADGTLDLGAARRRRDAERATREREAAEMPAQRTGTDDAPVVVGEQPQPPTEARPYPAARPLEAVASASGGGSGDGGGSTRAPAAPTTTRPAAVPTGRPGVVRRPGPRSRAATEPAAPAPERTTPPAPDAPTTTTTPDAAAPARPLEVTPQRRSALESERARLEAGAAEAQAVLQEHAMLNDQLGTLEAERTRIVADSPGPLRGEALARVQDIVAMMRALRERLTDLRDANDLRGHRATLADARNRLRGIEMQLDPSASRAPLLAPGQRVTIGADGVIDAGLGGDFVIYRITRLVEGRLQVYIGQTVQAGGARFTQHATKARTVLAAFEVLRAALARHGVVDASGTVIDAAALPTPGTPEFASLQRAFDGVRGAEQRRTSPFTLETYRDLAGDTRSFYEFMQHAEPQVIVRGLPTEACASVYEQHNINVERDMGNTVMNRREQLVTSTESTTAQAQREAAARVRPLVPLDDETSR